MNNCFVVRTPPFHIDAFAAVLGLEDKRRRRAVVAPFLVVLAVAIVLKDVDTVPRFLVEDIQA
jgi:hypothetical protein